MTTLSSPNVITMKNSYVKALTYKRNKSNKNTRSKKNRLLQVRNTRFYDNIKRSKTKRRSIVTKYRDTQRIAGYLKMICSDSCGCLVFARENTKVKTLFNGFNNFDLTAEKDVQKIGKNSVNGFGYEIQFEKYGYEASTLLKSSVNKYTDNLYYEYLVGIHFVNKMNIIFPCFTETYHILRNNSSSLKQEMMTLKKIPVDKIKENYEILQVTQDKGFEISCMDSDKLAILVQYIKNPTPLIDFVENKQIFNTITLTQMFFQIYGPLSQIRNEYTHYDLHGDNVLLYKLENETYITMNYIYKDRTITFKTNNIAKIIDYGKSFFESSDLSTSRIKKKICLEKKCNINFLQCGNELGYNLTDESTEKNFYMSQLIPNVSHDLRLAYLLGKRINDNSDLDILLKKVVYKTFYGTPQMIDNKPHSEILNVIDIVNALQILISNTDYAKFNDKLYKNHRSIGELMIYMDEQKPMIFNDNSFNVNLTNKNIGSMKRQISFSNRRFQHRESSSN